jgi:26S proteasome regulatory subunit N9
LADASEQMAMKKALAGKVNRPDSQDAYVLAQVAISQAYLEKREFPEARKILDECEGILDTFDSVETVVHASFYRENADYFKVRTDRTPISII